MLRPFYEINFGIENPFRIGVDEIYDFAAHDKSKMIILPVHFLTEKFIEIFSRTNIKVKDIVLWKWKLEYNGFIHTDGNYFSKIKRLCGLNYSFSPGTSVQFFDNVDKGTPIYKIISKENFSTQWIFDQTPIILDEWAGLGPVIINTQIPHAINLGDSNKNRRSVTLRFNDETYESLYYKLKLNDYISCNK